jgi:hypothetical protein
MPHINPVPVHVIDLSFLISSALFSGCIHSIELCICRSKIFIFNLHKYLKLRNQNRSKKHSRFTTHKWREDCAYKKYTRKANILHLGRIHLIKAIREKSADICAESRWVMNCAQGPFCLFSRQQKTKLSSATSRSLKFNEHASTRRANVIMQRLGRRWHTHNKWAAECEQGRARVAFPMLMMCLREATAWSRIYSANMTHFLKKSYQEWRDPTALVITTEVIRVLRHVFSCCA